MPVLAYPNELNRWEVKVLNHILLIDLQHFLP